MSQEPRPERAAADDPARWSRRHFLEMTGVAGAGMLWSGMAGCGAVQTSAGAAGLTPSDGAGDMTTSTGLGVVAFEFACASDLFARGLHPRLLADADDLVRLRQACATGWPRTLLASLRDTVAPIVKRVNDADDPAALFADTADPRNHAASIALVGLLDDDAPTLDAGRRILAHGPVSYGPEGDLVLAYDLLHNHLAPEERERFVAGSVTGIDRGIQSAGPRYRLGAGGNKGMTRMLAALGTCLAIEGDPTAPDLTERREALLIDFEAAIYSAIGPEGYPAEDIGYGTLMGSRLLRLALQLRRAGYYDAFTRAPRLAQLGRAMLHFVQPWGMFLTNTGDHGDDFRARELPLATLARFHNDPALTWLLTTLFYPPVKPQARRDNETILGPGMQIPTTAVALLTLADVPAPVHPRDADLPTAFMDSDRGIASFRDGWDDDSTYVYFDGSRRPTSAQGHAHDSAGHFNLSSVGEYFAVSPGRYGVEQDQHNVLLVDGKSGRSTEGQWRASWYQGQLLKYQPGDLCDYAMADCTQQADCYWSYRHFGLVKGGPMPGWAWTVDDVNGANDFRSFWWTLYAAPNNVVKLHPSHAQVIGRERGGVLDVHFAIPSPDSYPDPHTLELAQDMPWTSSHEYVAKDWPQGREHRDVHHAVFNRPRLVAKVKGYNGRVLAVMIPRRAGDPPPRVEALPTHLGALAMRIERGGVEDTFIFAYGHALLEAHGVRARGRWVVVRRDAATRRVLAHAITQGDWLEVDGRPVKL